MSKMVSLICGCCGKYFKGEPDPDHDRGYGVCDPCKEWQIKLFVDKRLKLLRENLKPENVRKLDAMTREQQEAIVFKAVEDGLIT